MSVEFSVDIERPLDEVFAYASDMARLPVWGDGILDVKLKSNEPIGLGTEFIVKATALGRTMEIPNKVTAFEPNRLFAFETEGSMPYISTRNFKSTSGSTRIVEVIAGANNGMLASIMNPLAERFVKRIHVKSLEQLKEILESKKDQKG